MDDSIVQCLSEEVKMKKNKTQSELAFQKKMFKNSTKTAVEMCNKLIKDKKLREQNISVIKAVNGKKIRNTSGI